MDPEWSLALGAFLLAASSVLALALPARAKHLIYYVSSAGLLWIAGGGYLFSRGGRVELLRARLGGAFEFLFAVDPLSGLFVLLVSVLGAAVSVYSAGYVRHMERPGLMGFLYHTFLLSMYAVLLSGNAVTFLIAWESMGVVSYFLVTFYRDKEAERAGLLYAVMTHAGTALIITGFLVLYNLSGSMEFEAMAEAARDAAPRLRDIVFILFLIGFGVKAGAIPFHTWLPRAHPAAPSNISALMSGVMIKTGVYGIVRFCMDLPGPGPEWWGLLVIATGTVSSVLGVMYALMESDMKKLLAYSSIENVGIIFLGLGAAMMFGAHGLSALAALALSAALYHTFNHSLFKGLLFLGAGSVLHATHTKDMERMGGLLKLMPMTGLFFLAGAMSICALPPMNGFVSEWLTYQALLLGVGSPSLLSKILSPLGGAALALTGALAAAAMVKAFGIAFLGLPREEEARGAREVSRPMVAAMGALAALCLLAGVLPGLVMDALGPGVTLLTGSGAPAVRMGTLMVPEAASGLSPWALMLTLVVMAGAAALFFRSVGARGRTVKGPSWDCGIPALTPRMQYSAAGFIKPLRIIFRRIYLPRAEIRVGYSVKPLFVSRMSYREEITPFFERYVYGPAIEFFVRAASRVRMLQSGSLHQYLAYILVTLIVLLVFVV